MTRRFGDWGYSRDDFGCLHMVPMDDIAHHYTENCPCMPELVNGLHIHHSFDDREKFETGERLPS